MTELPASPICPSRSFPVRRHQDPYYPILNRERAIASEKNNTSPSRTKHAEREQETEADLLAIGFVFLSGPPIN